MAIGMLPIACIDWRSNGESVSFILSQHKIADWFHSMISLRGGLERLGFPTHTIKLMVWYDAYMAAESGTPPYFSDVPHRLRDRNIPTFSQEEAIRVTDEANPKRHLHPGYGDAQEVP